MNHNRYSDLQGGGAPPRKEHRDDRSMSSGGSGSRRSGTSRGAEDLAKGKDTIFTTKVMKYMLKQHPQWHELGLAYDCGSSLYTSAKLDFPETDTHEKALPKPADADLDYTSRSSSGFTDGPRYEYDIVWPNSTEISLKVVIAPVSHIMPPIVGEPAAETAEIAVDATNTRGLHSTVAYRWEMGDGRWTGRRAHRAGGGGDGQAPPHLRDGAGRGPAVLRALESGGPRPAVDHQRQQGLPVSEGT